MAFPCVPFNAAWTSSTKLDLKAIYRRSNGDLMTLPMRRHIDWEAKGFTYVTLADHDSLMAVAHSLPNVREYVVGLDGDGRQTPWDVALYLADRRSVESAEAERLAALVAEHGADVVEQITGKPVPAELRGKAKTKKAVGVPA